MTRHSHRDAGTVAVIAALCLVVLLGFVALGVESGYVYVVRAQAQTAADGASLAAVRALQSCDAGTSDLEAARQAARASLQENLVGGTALELDDADIEFGRYYPFGTGSERTFQPTSASPNSVRITVHRDSVRNGPVELAFAKLLGVDSVDVAAGAIASRDRRIVGFDAPDGTTGKLIPFVGRASDIGGVGSTVRFFEGANPQAAGNWGLLDLAADGTGFQTGISNGTSVVVEQIEDGYDGTAVIDPLTGTNSSGRPGQLAGSIRDALESRVGQTVVIATYDSVTGQGTNAIYHLTGFVAVEITAIVVTGPIGQRGIWARLVETSDSTALTDPDAAENCLISKIVLAG